MRTSLVLGAGGTVGIAYHAGVLRALEEVGGLRADDADLIVGTSAGSMVGALLRAGLSTDELFQASLGLHPELNIEQEGSSPWSSTVGGPADVVRRVLGSAYVLQRSLVRVPVPRLPRASVLQDLFPDEWPAKPLWLVTVDVRTGRRVVLGRRVPARTDLTTAVKASCAIPGFFQPVRVGHRTLVDGGVHSSTNLDLATKVSPELVVAVVPMSAHPSAEPGLVDRRVRAFAERSLARELRQARRLGAKTLVIRPTQDDLRAMGGLNMMRREGNEVVTRTAYETTARLLSTGYAQDLFAQLASSRTVTVPVPA